MGADGHDPDARAFKIFGQSSRKPDDRVFGTAATVAYCIEHGAAVLRVHDVGAMVDVVKTVTAIRHGCVGPNEAKEP